MTKYKVLVADDEKNTRNGIKLALDKKRFTVDTAENGEVAFALFKEHAHHIVISDLRMAREDDGMQLLQDIKSLIPQTIIIMITAYGDMETAVKAMKLGAFDFIAKPFNADQIEVKVNKAAENITLLHDNQLLRSERSKNYALIGESSVMQNLKKNIQRVAGSDSSVLITGSHGTGKELVARAIQEHSLRADKPFVTLNCSSITDTLIESELFGFMKGAHSEARSRKLGQFEIADSGTILLDEIGDMSLSAQAKVLRAIEYGEITPVGSEKNIHVNVRVIAATNKDLGELIHKGQFREDLYYRLNTLIVQTPPLSVRKDDIPLLIEHYLNKTGKASSVDRIFTKGAIEHLKTWHWPGNVRELYNVVERALIHRDNDTIDADQIKGHIYGMPSALSRSDNLSIVSPRYLYRIPVLTILFDTSQATDS